MSARVQPGPMPGALAEAALARPEPGLLDALLALACAARAITGQHHRQPTERERLALGDATAAVVRLGKLHGLDSLPAMGPGEAVRTYRAAMKAALDAGVPRLLLRQIFNGEEDAADEGGRKDLM